MDWGRYVNGHAKKHYEDAQINSNNIKKSEKHEKEKLQHAVCMDCSSYSTFCYRCDDFVVNDTKMGLVQRVREHLQNLENSAISVDRHRKRKLMESSSVSKYLKINKLNPASQFLSLPPTLCSPGLHGSLLWAGVSGGLKTGRRAQGWGKSQLLFHTQTHRTGRAIDKVRSSCAESGTVRHSPAQHQEDGEPLGNLVESGTIQTLLAKWGHSMSAGPEAEARPRPGERGGEGKAVLLLSLSVGSHCRGRVGRLEEGAEADAELSASEAAFFPLKPPSSGPSRSAHLQPPPLGLGYSGGERQCEKELGMDREEEEEGNIQQFCCYFKELPAVELRSGKTAGRRTYHTRSQGDNSVSLVEEFRKTLCALWQGSQTAFCPESLFYVIWKIMPNFRGYQQQDAHEFMRYLLDHLHLELQRSYNGMTTSFITPDSSSISSSSKCCVNGVSTIVTNIFGGILQNEVNCLICGTESRKFDPFLDLSLDIPSQFRNKRSKNQDNGPVCTLRDCLRSFTDLEELDETELYMCHKCKKRQKSTKKFWIQKLPKVLCLHLKRFHWTAYLRNKIDTYVEFPLRGLDMKCFLLEPENSGPESCLYDLAAVVVHHGSGVGSGHYTAYATHEGRWFHFNDSTVTLTEEETVMKAKAYILFYVERQTKSGSGTKL
ncbi:ubiquitin carboxyl-terminal hydrolase 3 [Chiloscyllium plagiosum]|uniref:ubiquitin carboxyl-terminal hydrolase 3 n=1 Tax=Chiloscyllium plagiosum TaxID=36176 RepID=UPI001CB7EFC2|nr:ubiquitin carboxyl-terminal hydrolase 3 [Chiloscyllium plagiosum]